MTTPNAEIVISTELLRLILDLPESYHITGARHSPQDEEGIVRLVVDATRLPAIDEGASPHLVTPLYQRVETGQATLQAVQIVASADRVSLV